MVPTSPPRPPVTHPLQAPCFGGGPRARERFELLGFGGSPLGGGRGRVERRHCPGALLVGEVSGRARRLERTHLALQLVRGGGGRVSRRPLRVAIPAGNCQPSLGGRARSRELLASRAA